MGQCYGKTIPTGVNDNDAFGVIATAASGNPNQAPPPSTPHHAPNTGPATPARPSVNSPWASPFPAVGVSPSPARATPRRKFLRRPFPPPSPAKHIKASLVKRFGYLSPKQGTIPEESRAGDGGGAGGGGAAREESEGQQLDKSFGYNKNFGAKYELGKEVGRGHFGHTCSAKGKKGELKDQVLAVKIISKAKVHTL